MVSYSLHTQLEIGYTGILGIQPYTYDESRKEQNFLWQLKNRGLIDHMTVAFYVNNADTGNAIGSIVKFGSMDKNGLKDSIIKKGEKVGMYYLKTKNKTTWDL